MELTSNNTIAKILERHKAQLLADWLKEQQNTGLWRDDLIESQRIAFRVSIVPVIALHCSRAR